jgi:YD repeat-containing protein
VTSFGWAFGHRLTSRTNLAAGNLTITRNDLGQPLVATSYAPGSSATVLVAYTHTYDSLYRPDFVTDSRGGVALDYDFSPAGRLNQLSDSHGNATNYLYDALGRLTGIWTPSYGTVSFRHDPGGRRVEKWLPNGISTRYAWNPDGSLKQVVNRASATSLLTQHDYLSTASATAASTRRRLAPAPRPSATATMRSTGC